MNFYDAYEIDTEKTSKRLRQLVRACPERYTPKMIAELVGKTERTVKRWFSPKTSTLPGLQDLLLLCDLCGTDMTNMIVRKKDVTKEDYIAVRNDDDSDDMKTTALLNTYEKEKPVYLKNPNYLLAIIPYIDIKTLGYILGYYYPLTPYLSNEQLVLDKLDAAVDWLPKEYKEFFQSFPEGPHDTISDKWAAQYRKVAREKVYFYGFHLGNFLYNLPIDQNALRQELEKDIYEYDEEIVLHMVADAVEKRLSNPESLNILKKDERDGFLDEILKFIKGDGCS